MDQGGRDDRKVMRIMTPEEADRADREEEFDAGDANKTAHFMLQWVGTRGGLGPISETVSATVPG